MQRRTFLAATSTAALAGCTGDSGSGTGNETPTADRGIRTLSFGEPLTTETGITLTTTDPQVANRIVVEGEAYEAENGNVFVLAHLEAENTAKEPRTAPGYDSIDLLSGNNQYSRSRTRDGDIESPVTGTTYAPSEAIHPGITVSGWVIFEVPRDTSSITLAVTEYEVFEVVDTAYWKGSIDPSKISNVKFSSLNAPETAKLGDTAKIEVVAENTGGSSGTFDQEFAYRWPDDRRDQTASLSFPVNASSTESENITANATTVGDLSVWIEGEFATIEITPAEVEIGDAYQLPNGASVQFQKVNLTTHYRYQVYDGEELVPAPGGKQFLIAFYDIENPGSETGSAPGTDGLYAIGPSERYPAVSSEYYGAATFTDPIIGEEFTNGYSLSVDPDERFNGWVLFEVDSRLDKEELGLQLDWESGYGNHIIVNWR